MKKEKSNILCIIKDASILCAITLIAGVLLAGVHQMTQNVIAEKKEKEQNEAFKKVCKEADSFIADEETKELVSNEATYLAEAGLKNVIVTEMRKAVDASENIIGYVALATSKEGYGGDISLLVGFSKEKTITGVEILAISETPGLGMKVTAETFRKQYENKNVESFVVTKNGATKENEIDSVSGATISSNAVTNAVNACLVMAYKLQE